MSFGLSLLVAGMFAGFGYLGRKNLVWAIAVGMILYALDGLIYLFFQDWMSFGFHLFALWGLYGGLQTAWAWRQHQSGLARQPRAA